jgi:tRNA G18 (ribose-2'-O)-methylase SpoU
LIDREDDERLAPYRRVGDPRWLASQGLFVAEGRLVVERVFAHGGYDIDSILVTPAAYPAVAQFITPGVAVHVATQAVVDGVTGFNFHRGCLALVRRPAENLPLDRFSHARRLVVLEGVGNPDNLGGIFRSAAALGADGIILDRSSGDPWYRKAVRTSMGAVLRMPFTRAERWPDALRTLRDEGFVVAALTPAGGCTLDELKAGVTSSTRLAFVAGAEGPGLTTAALAEATSTVRIPVDERSDSLNVVVAVSIALAAVHAVDTVD